MPRKKSDDGFRIEDVLAAFRALEESDDAIVVLNDENAMKVLVAWSHTDQQWTRPDSKPPPATHGRMARLWTWVVSGWEIDPRRVAQLAGVPVTVAHEKISVLVGNRLIYPDGTMAKGARQALGVYTARKLGIKQRPRPESPARATPAKTDEGN